MVRAVAISLGVLLCWSGAARADKPRIAVLGLEVAPGPGGAVDPGAQLIAREVTKELRLRVLSPVCPFAMAPNSTKELLDEKHLMSCDNEAPDCMVVISAGLASDALLYGHVDKRGDGGFHISLKLLDVKRKAIQSAADDLPSAGGIVGASRRLYRRLIGDGPGATGTLIVKAHSDAGTVRAGSVTIDDEDRGQLVGGKLTVTGIGEGRHTVAIDVGGARRFEEIVAIRGGEIATLDARLRGQPAAMPVPAASGAAAIGMAGAAPIEPGPTAAPRPEAPESMGALPPSPLWKAALVAGAATAVAGGAFAWYSYDRQQAHTDHIHADIGNDRCGDSDAALATSAPAIDPAAFHRACTWHTRIYEGYAVAGLGAVAAVVSLIMMSRDPGQADHSALDDRRHRSAIAVAPVIAPGLAGARIALAW